MPVNETRANRLADANQVKFLSTRGEDDAFQASGLPMGDEGEEDIPF